MERLALFDGPGQLRNTLINERNRMREENPHLERQLLDLLQQFPEESFESDPRLAAQYGAGYGYLEYESRQIGPSASPDFMPDIPRHAFNAFMATLPDKHPQRSLTEMIFRITYVKLRGGTLSAVPTEINPYLVDEAVAFIKGYRLISSEA